eukprot:395068-Amphidinium_carterae.1
MALELATSPSRQTGAIIRNLELTHARIKKFLASLNMAMNRKTTAWGNSAQVVRVLSQTPSFSKYTCHRHLRDLGLDLTSYGQMQTHTQRTRLDDTQMRIRRLYRAGLTRTEQELGLVCVAWSEGLWDAPLT